jgi:hypothetical protein
MIPSPHCPLDKDPSMVVTRRQGIERGICNREASSRGYGRRRRSSCVWSISCSGSAGQRLQVGQGRRELRSRWFPGHRRGGCPWKMRMSDRRGPHGRTPCGATQSKLSCVLPRLLKCWILQESNPPPLHPEIKQTSVLLRDQRRKQTQEVRSINLSPVQVPPQGKSVSTSCSRSLNPKG